MRPHLRASWLARSLSRASFALLLAFASSASDAAQKGSEKSKDQRKEKQETLEDYYKNWLKRDVSYIITPEEKAVFLKLQSNEEKEQFIEQFWKRRDPDPTTPTNEYKEEHYRRIQYANDVFAAGIPGWMTDRGRIYIKFGKPDRIETHPAGGPYERPWHEGGGRTSTYPFERWEYRHIEGIGDDIEIEFVDYSGGNLYRISHNPLEKDEFLHVPWAGLTDAEENPFNRDPADLRWRRVAGIREYGLADSMGISGERAKYSPFARTELAANLGKPPVIHFNDLRVAITTRVSFNAISFQAHTYFLRLADNAALAPLTLQIPNSSVAFQSEEGMHTSRLQVYGKVSGLTGNTVYEFDDEIVNTLNAEQYAAQRNSTSVYHRPLRLPPGRFKLEVLVKDAIADKMGVVEQGITVPAFPAGKLTSSPVIVASELSPIPEDELERDPYAFGRFRVRPRLGGRFHKGEYLGVYFEIYNAALDPSKGKPVLKVEYQIQTKGQALGPFRDVSRSAVQERDLVVVPLFVDVSSQPAGTYSIILRITDLVSTTTTESRGTFQISS